MLHTSPPPLTADALQQARARDLSIATPQGRSWSFRRLIAVALDVLIAAYVLALMVIFVTGGVDLRVVTLNQGAKPLLTLFIIVPLRIALGERSLLLETTRRWVPQRLAAVWTLALDRARVSPGVADVVFVLIVTRAATFSIGLIANVLFPSARARSFAMPFRHEKFAEIFAAWDSGWYFDIASRGYYFNPDGQSSIAFFPLYPMSMRAVAWPFGGSDTAVWAAGIAVSCIAFALALLAIHRLTQQIFGDREIARRAVLYLAVFPFSIFFTRVYAESLFLLTSVLAVSRAYEGRWWRAGVWGALATLTRPNGILIGLPLALLALAGRPAPRVLIGRFTALLLVPVALAGYCAYVYALSGDPLAWLFAQAQWGYSLGHPPWQQLLGMIARIEIYGFYDYFFVSKVTAFHLFHGVAALTFLALFGIGAAFSSCPRSSISQVSINIWPPARVWRCCCCRLDSVWRSSTTGRATIGVGRSPAGAEARMRDTGEPRRNCSLSGIPIAGVRRYIRSSGCQRRSAAVFSGRRPPGKEPGKDANGSYIPA